MEEQIHTQDFVDRPASMAWVLQNGVRSWVDPDFVVIEGSLATLTVVARECPSLASVLSDLMADARVSFDRLIRWHTLGRPLPGTKMQAKQMMSAMGSRIWGFGELTVELDDSTLIPVSNAQLEPPFSPRHFEALTDYMRTVLLLTKDAQLTEKQISKAMRPFMAEISNQNIVTLAAVASRELSSIIARFYDNGCAYCTVDFFGEAHILDEMRNVLQDLQLPQITPDKISSFTHLR